MSLKSLTIADALYRYLKDDISTCETFSSAEKDRKKMIVDCFNLCVELPGASGRCTDPCV